MKTKYYYIRDIKDLDQLRNLEEGQKAVAVFYYDITLNDGEEFEPIDARTNTIVIEGYNHKIKNLTINKPNNNCVGLFSIVKSLTIKNISIENAKINGLEVCGTLAGEVSDDLVIDNVKVNSVINSDAISGGIAGSAKDISIKNTKINASIFGRGILGGIAGSANSLLSDDKTNIEVSLNDSYRQMISNTGTHNRVGYLSTLEEQNMMNMIATDMSRLPVEVTEREMKLLLSMCHKDNN